MAKNKTSGNILVISPYIPAYDTNAGDWRIFTTCRELSKTYNVHILPLLFSWDSEKYLNALKKIGVKPVLPGYEGISDIRTLDQKYNFRAIIVEFFHTALHFQHFLLTCKKVIIDTHELYYVREGRRAETEKKSFSGDYVKSIKERELNGYRMADLLIAISEEEREVLQKEFPHKKIVLMPMWVEASGRYRVTGFRERKDIVFFASFFNREHLDAVVYFAKEILPFIRRALPGVSLHIAGCHSAILRDLLADDIEQHKIIIDGQIDNIRAYLSGFRVFVCPLRYGAGMKKKILDAAVAACPVVTTPVGLEGFALVPGKEVLVATRPKDFAAKVIAAHEDRELWDTISGNALARVKKENRYGLGLESVRAYINH